MDYENLQVILDGMNEKDISSVLEKWKEVRDIKNDITKIEEMLKVKIRTFLEERQWDSFSDDKTGANVKIIEMTRRKINEDKLKDILNKTQLDEVTDVSLVKRMTITTEDDRKRMKNFMKRK